MEAFLVVLAVLGAAWLASTPSGLRLIGLRIVRRLWPLRVRGLDHLPDGGALLVANHVSYADGPLIAAALPRPVSFLMHRSFFGRALYGPLARRIHAIPVASGDGGNALRAALGEAARRAQAGELVCIFAEGGITRSGSLLPFGRGLEIVARQARVPIVPLALWGGADGGGALRGRRNLWPRPRRRFQVALGTPLPADTPAWRVRAAVAELLADSAAEALGPADTLARRFLGAARRAGSAPAISDSSGRALSHRRLLIAALALARLLRERVPEPRVGVLLPPGVPGAVVSVALALAGKQSVHLNATYSPQELAGPARRARLARVITSPRVLEALGWSELPAQLPALQVEELMAGLTIGRKLRAALTALLPAPWLARFCAPAVRPQDPATVMFSSGSTGEPKGVVLTHGGLVANIDAVLQAFDLAPGDRMLGALPFFHSFGHTATLWAPLLAGASVAYHSSPLDARGVAELARKVRPTVLLGTPAFYQGWMRRLEREDVAQVRIAFSGASKLPPRLAEAFGEHLGVQLLEGYGCTELSPVVAVNRVDVESLGVRERGSAPGSVGRPLAGIALRVVDEQGRALPPGEEGDLLVKSPARMQGYLGDPARTDEVLEAGWYRTGDVARVDEEGFLFLTDRRARFSKIAGEMVSHGRVEEVLHAALCEVQPEALPCELFVTGVPDERKGERLVVLHTPLPLTPEALLARLAPGALPPLFIPRAEAFLEVAELPKLGSGKLDLARLVARARAHFGEARAAQSRSEARPSREG